MEGIRDENLKTVCDLAVRQAIADILQQDPDEVTKKHRGNYSPLNGICKPYATKWVWNHYIRTIESTGD